ncbi:hypothetical protein MIZ03_2502 [Rhodoferax lithotrophicus]|uniref:Uncharacterized protein n=1 Tax=Rhodoferax lithotrophicus TaxID=2798804 RepID=A0ABM7MMX9_9BURK|nr:hypothetical protein [Rhodoferax sp. MIZ03]BCO27613.1 hypothetical protein MIZ03_2502 [Rhodoferax sp. MIZ03]
MTTSHNGHTNTIHLASASIDSAAAAAFPASSISPTALAWALGFEAKLMDLPASELADAPAPLILLMNAQPELGLLMQANATEVTWVAANTQDPDQPALGSSKTNPAFDFKWFVPELLKHRKVWRDVLWASLLLQLLALGLPLFTQAIIDKVVVHRTQSTLIAIAIIVLATLNTLRTPSTNGDSTVDAAAMNLAQKVYLAVANPITPTYTFNGAGVGQVNTGHTLSDISATFARQRRRDAFFDFKKFNDPQPKTCKSRNKSHCKKIAA